MQRRWYELSPDVCIVMSKIELAKEEDRTRYAKIMLSELEKAGYEPNIQVYSERIENYVMRRWYDQNQFLFRAFEYLKDSTNDVQKTVCDNVLNFMKSENAA